MELTEKLLRVPQRENAGARSANRFSYQQVWAFNYMLEIMDSESDFILFMEFHDDIIILEKSISPEVIDFYQIKTDDKPSRYLTASFITKNANKYPEKMSIAQKMIDNFVKFNDNTRGMYLVSNKSFDFGELNDKTESIKRDNISLQEIDSENLTKIKKGMCQACNKKDKCNNECIKLIYFSVSNLDLTSYEDTVLGKLVNKLLSQGIESSIGQTKSTYYTILGEIRRINNCERNSQNVTELLKNKSISKSNFIMWINQLKVNLPDDLWNQIQPLLLNDGFSALTVSRIMKHWKKYKLDIMNVDAVGLLELAREIAIIKEEQVFENIKEWTDYIYRRIANKSNARFYEKEYLYAIIIKELLS